MSCRRTDLADAWEPGGQPERRDRLDAVPSPHVDRVALPGGDDTRLQRHHLDPNDPLSVPRSIGSMRWSRSGESNPGPFHYE